MMVFGMDERGAGACGGRAAGHAPAPPSFRFAFDGHRQGQRTFLALPGVAGSISQAWGKGWASVGGVRAGGVLPVPPEKG